MKLTLVAEQSSGKMTSLGHATTSPEGFPVAKLASMMFSVTYSYKHPNSYTHHACPQGIHLHFYLPCSLLHFFLDTTTTIPTASTSWFSWELPCSAVVPPHWAQLIDPV